MKVLCIDGGDHWISTEGEAIPGPMTGEELEVFDKVNAWEYGVAILESFYVFVEYGLCAYISTKFVEIELDEVIEYAELLDLN